MANDFLSTHSVRCVALESRQMRLGSGLKVSFQRAQQLTKPAGKVSPSYGALPIAIDSRAAPAADLVVPLDDEDAMWIGFVATSEEPVAVRVRVLAPEQVDAVTGGKWVDAIAADPQNYVVCPGQSALHGVQIEPDCARQFARVAQTSNAVGIERLELTSICSRTDVRAVEAPHGPSPADRHEGRSTGIRRFDCPGVPQTIVVDPHGLGFWSGARCTVSIALVSPDEYSALTGEPRLAPLDPADTYRGWRLP